MGQAFSNIPRVVDYVETKYRRIKTKLPVPESVAILKAINQYEPISMQGQPPLVWDKAEGFQVYDAYGNIWLDWSSGVLVANTGHSHLDVKNAIIETAEKGLIFSYCFPTEIRVNLARKIVEIAPAQLNKVFILTTGSETTENAIKIAKTYGQKHYSSRKNVIVTFDLAFHGRTMGAQMAGGSDEAKRWIGDLDRSFVQVPFPDGFRFENTNFEIFERTLEDKMVDPACVAAVMMESYQGGGASFAPIEYVQSLSKWCSDHDALLIFDEVQAGFGRTGKMFAFEHYEVVPDLVCLGKGISSSLPLSAVLGRGDLMDMYGPGAMTSTHGGNPVCCAAALKNIEILINEKMIENAATTGKKLHDGLLVLKNKYKDFIGALHGKGLVYGLHFVKNGGKEPYSELAEAVVEKCFQKGLLLFAPVGYGGATIKICPPLMITDDAVREGLEVLNEAIRDAVESLS